MNKVTSFLMFNDQLKAAIAFYTATLPHFEVRTVAPTGTDGAIRSTVLIVGGHCFLGYNGGSYFRFSEGPSLYMDCTDQAEADTCRDKLVTAAAKPTQCGWITDPFGLAWQTVPTRY